MLGDISIKEVNMMSQPFRMFLEITMILWQQKKENICRSCMLITVKRHS